MGLWSAEALLVGPTRAPLQVVVNGPARTACGHLRTCIAMAFLTAFLSNHGCNEVGLQTSP